MIMMVMMIIMERIRDVINKSRIKVTRVVMIMYIRIALFSVLIIKTSVIELEYMELH